MIDAAGHQFLLLFVSKLVCLSSGPELPRPPQVPPWSEPGVRERDAGSPSACSVLHRHSNAATVHSGDPHQDAPLPNQAQAGLHTNGHRYQVESKRKGCLTVQHA